MGIVWYFFHYLTIQSYHVWRVHIAGCLLLPFYDSAHLVAVLDGGLSLLDPGLELAEAVGNGNFEVAAIRGCDIITPADDVTLCSAGFVVHILVEGSTSQQAYCEAVVAEEGAL